MNFQELIKYFHSNRLLQRFVVDEAHCVEEWGVDFRPDYKQLSILRLLCPDVPVVAVSATVTPRARAAIAYHLMMSNEKWFVTSFNRPNLQFKVIKKFSNDRQAIQQVAILVKEHFNGVTGVVYCWRKKDCEIYAKALNLKTKNSKLAAAYHADLPDSDRLAVQEKWLKGEV